MGGGLGHRFQVNVAGGELATYAAEPGSIVLLPSGRVLDIQRSRWDGPLNGEELNYCQSHGIPLAYDCAQIGWVTEACRDDDSIVATAGPLFERPAELVDAERACATLRLRAQRQAGAGAWTLGQRAAAEHQLT